MTRISGVDIGTRSIRKGAVDAILKQSAMAANAAPAAFRDAVDRVSRTGGTPLGVAEGNRLLGVIHLKDVVKPDIKHRFAALPRHGHPHGDGDRRQPGDGCGHRIGSRRR